MMGSNELQLLVQRALYAVVNASLESETELLALSHDVIGFRRVKLATILILARSVWGYKIFVSSIMSVVICTF